MRRLFKVALVTTLLVVPSVRTREPYFGFWGPDTALRLEKNGSWTAQLPVPEPYVQTIGQHVERMYARGYFEDFTYTDFWHGHLMLRPEASGDYTDVGALMQDVVLCIYHTAEHAERWDRQKPLPPEQRTPRSLVGFPDGSVIPAIRLVRPGTFAPFYESNGTISDSELVASHPEWFRNTMEPTTIRIGEQVSCAAGMQFLVLQDPWGRLLLGRMRYDVYIVCELDPRELGLRGYDSYRRDYVTPSR